MYEFKMPSLGADMNAGTVVAWQKQPGEVVHHGDMIAEVETDKGVIDVEAFADGVLEKILVPVGEHVSVGTVLALIHETESDAHLAAEPTLMSSIISHPSTGEPPRLPMSPSARRLARELNVDPKQITGTGHGGAITREDIERAAKRQLTATATAVATSAKDDERTSRMRLTIAAAMAKSKREIPHYYLGTTIDFQPAMNWIAETNLQRPVTERLLYGVLLLKAVARALKEVPELNSIWENGQALQKTAVHLGVAILLRQGGLIAPAIHNADRLSITDLMEAFRDLVTRARTGKLTASELSDPTITVTSLGERGVEAVYGVIYPPQTAIVGFGKVVERPWSIHGGLMSRQVITATLSADHRVSDGHRGALFLNAVDRLLQTPEKL